MTTKKPRTEKRRHAVKRQKFETLIEEVDSFEGLGTRMQELLLTEPEGTRIYLRVRKDTTIN